MSIGILLGGTRSKENTVCLYKYMATSKFVFRFSGGLQTKQNGRLVPRLRE
ncbi:hypothetical protein [Bacillus sp. OV322]|uniref:hypothetical protein n=1 Tax=Bacillus sp. OV322 TaxID=1882764 RepID=UPI0015A6BA6F|nr:hypothetical protein [Bacillus sp. OV322]